MSLKYDRVIGVGGIGVGILFYTDENRQLGRNESRMVVKSDAKDYCKQHIVLHYPSRLLAPQLKVIPIGFVGNDQHGISLIDDMNRVGMDTSHIMIHPVLPTMISICLQYPDKAGCNITSCNNTADMIDGNMVENLLEQLAIDEHTIIAAIPEVNISCRVAMLKKGFEKGSFCVLSVPESEALEFEECGAYNYCNLIAVNDTEASAIAEYKGSNNELIRKLYQKLRKYNKNIMVIMTCGQLGAYSAYDGNIEYIPVLSSKVVNTTGAGDAFLGGIISGISMGLSLQKGISDKYFGETPLTSAAELGALCAGMAVESKDSIAWEVDNHSILKRIKTNGWVEKILNIS